MTTGASGYPAAVSVIGKSIARLIVSIALVVLGSGLWWWHAHNWDLGGRSPVLSYDAAQYALAARELANHGRLATTFALPIELSHHSAPPWPLAVVQPGLVLIEAALFRIVPPNLTIDGLPIYRLARPDQREWLALVAPYICFLTLGAALALAVVRILGRHFPASRFGARVAAGAVVGIAFLLDPEAQHFAVGGFTELPFTLGLVLAIAGIALGEAALRPFAFGLLLGIVGSFRANMLWLAPVLGLAAASTAAPERRLRVLLLIALGYLIPTAPWWYYKWRAFGSPAWDLTRFVIWDGIGGRSWNTIYHLPDLPTLPTGFEAVRLLAMKVALNLGPLLLATLTGPRALWLGALVAWVAMVRAPRELTAAAVATLACFALGLLAAAAGIPWLRYVFPARAVLEAAGLLALWGLAARMPAAAGHRAGSLIAGGAAALAIVWGVISTVRGNLEARAALADRDLPGVVTMLATAVLMNREIPAGEAVMSNLGPTLAWHARRPVIHLALAPADLDACRRKLDFHHVILVYRKPERAGPGWSEIVARPKEAQLDPELNIMRTRVWNSEDGFRIVWLELGGLKPRLAGAPGTVPPSAAGVRRAVSARAAPRATG